MDWTNVYFVTGTAYAGKSTLVKNLAREYDGIACEENYHDALLPTLNKADFPALCYTRDLKDWHDFIRRTPDEYEAWIDAVSKECETLEMRILQTMRMRGKRVFVDTNISLETLRRISDEKHVLVMLADPMVSVRRFFERPDREKQFLYRLITEEKDRQAALENFRHCLERVNSPKVYDMYLNAGFPVLLRDENRTQAETLRRAAQIFALAPQEGEKA